MLKLVAHTPYGVFYRKTNTRYTHIALAYHADGSPVRVVGAAMVAGKAGTQYLARWSTTPDGAVRNAANYGYDRNLSVYGPYPVTAFTN